MKLCVDDEWYLEARYRGDDWIYCRDIATALGLLRRYHGQVTHLALDNDLGNEIPGLDGQDLVKTLCEYFFTEGEDCWPTETIVLQTRNPVARKNMTADISNPRYCPRPWMLTQELI
jgi:hypothetical protein